MTLTLELPPDLEGALTQEARREGTTPERLALDGLRRLFATTERTHLPAAEDATLALFAQWAIEDATGDPEEIARRNREWEDTKANLAANRLSLRDVSHLAGEEAS